MEFKIIKYKKKEKSHAAPNSETKRGKGACRIK